MRVDAKEVARLMTIALETYGRAKACDLSIGYVIAICNLVSAIHPEDHAEAEELVTALEKAVDKLKTEEN